MHHYIADILVDYIKRVTKMMTYGLAAVLLDGDSSDGMAIKQFLIIWISFNRHITTDKWNVESPVSQNLVNSLMC